MKKKRLNNLVVGFVAGVILTSIIAAIIWPSRIAKTKDGKDVVVELKGKSITAEELYGDLKNKYGISDLINIIDDYILRDKYDIEDEMIKEANEKAEGIYANYEQYYGMPKSEFLSSNGFKTEEEFKSVLITECYANHHIEEYVSSKVSDKEIKKYYDNNYFNDRNTYVIFNSESTEGLAEAASDLKKGLTVEEIKNKYPKLVVNNYQHLDYTNVDNINEGIFNLVVSTKVGEVSKVQTDEGNGNYIVYVKSEGKKESLKDMSDTIKKSIVANKMKEDANIQSEAMEELRKEYNIKFYDTELEKEYSKMKK